jgi:hypothetical protein
VDGVGGNNKGQGNILYEQTLLILITGANRLYPGRLRRKVRELEAEGCIPTLPVGLTVSRAGLL